MKTARWLIGISVAVGLYSGSRLVLADIPAPGGGGDPPLPSNQLNTWPFADTNWLSGLGYAPIAFTNLVNVVGWAADGQSANALLLDSTNAAFLNYNVVESDGTTNLSCWAGGAGSFSMWFSPSWDSADQGGAGPGVPGRFLEVGAWNTNGTGWFSVYTDTGGSNLCFSSSDGATGTNFISAPISWTNNSWHFLALTYSQTNSSLYIDGQWVTNGSGVAYWPTPAALTNGFFIGSDSTGQLQARGEFVNLTTWNIVLDVSLISPVYLNYSNLLGGWEPRPMDVTLQNGVPVPVSYLGPPVYLTNLTATLSPGQGTAVTFQIAGGTNGVLYDVFSTSALEPPRASAASWQWVTNGISGETISLLFQSGANACYILGTPADQNGDGITDACAALVYHDDPGAYVTPSSDGFGTPDAWYLAHQMNPRLKGIGTLDADNDGLLNWQEYQWGSDPRTPEGFSVWVASPATFSTIP